MSNVKFLRKTRSQVVRTPIVDGQYITETDQGDESLMYADDGDTRHIIGGRTPVSDTLTSTSTVNALSANQGRTLKQYIDNLSTVARTGSYNSLTDKPTIPTLKNVFGIVKVGTKTTSATSTQDTFEIEAGSNTSVSLSGKKITISGNYPIATTSKSGLMSTTDKAQLAKISSIGTIRSGKVYPTDAYGSNGDIYVRY